MRSLFACAARHPFGTAAAAFVVLLLFGLVTAREAARQEELQAWMRCCDEQRQQLKLMRREAQQVARELASGEEFSRYAGGMNAELALAYRQKRENLLIVRDALERLYQLVNQLIAELQKQKQGQAIAPERLGTLLQEIQRLNLELMERRVAFR